MYKIGSLFSGIGGFELGLERAIPAETIWQVEQDKFCQSILKKHWPKAKIYDDVRNITKDNVEPVDILCGGFPCQDISLAGKTRGLKGEKSGLWWEMWRIISELSEGRKKPIVVLENVSNILRLGGREVLGSLAKIGYNAEWTTILASDFGAPHRRERWFCVAYPNSITRLQTNTKSDTFGSKRHTWEINSSCDWEYDFAYPNSEFLDNDKSMEWKKRGQKTSSTRKMDAFNKISRKRKSNIRRWEENVYSPQFCHVDDGIPQRVAKIKALGNAIVPQCSQWIGEQIWKSGILQGGGYV